MEAVNIIVKLNKLCKDELSTKEKKELGLLLSDLSSKILRDVID